MGRYRYPLKYIRRSVDARALFAAFAHDAALRVHINLLCGQPRRILAVQVTVRF